MIFEKEVQPLYNERGNLQGVYISANKWHKSKDELEAVLFPDETKNSTAISRTKSEPTKDWELFLSYWDFNYPEEKKVECKNCGSHSEDWTLDSPRKFRLKSANLGGMVSFLCLDCRQRVTKKHFKDHICYECTPFGCNVK